VTRWVGIGAVLAVALSGLAVGGGVGSPAGGQTSETNGVDTLRNCLATNRRLDAVLVVDETQSLQSSDPENERVGALQAVIDAVALAAGNSGGLEPISVSLLIAGFGRNFVPTPEGWVDVNSSTIPELRGIAESFRNRNNVVGTDYLVALNGAQDALNQRAVDVSAPTPACRLVVLFSDGAYEFGPQPSGASVEYAPGLDLGDRTQREQAVASGFQQLCSEGGLLDRMRTTKPPTVLLGLGLGLGARSGDQLELDVPPEALFAAIATGSGPGGVVCGNPDSSAYGAVTTADEVRDLGIGIFCSLNGCAPSVPGAPGDPVTVAVDAGVTALIVQGAGSVPFDFTVTDPAGTTVSVPAGVAGPTEGLVADVVVEPQSGQFSVARIALPSDTAGAVGDWTIGALVNGRPAGGAVAVGVSRQSGLQLETDDALRLTVGEPATITAQLRSADGEDIGTSSLSGTYSATAELVAPGSLERVASVDATVDPASGEVTLNVGELGDTDLTNLFLEARLSGTYSDGQQRQPVILTRSLPVLRGGLPLVAAPGAGVRLSGVRGGTDDPTARGTVPVSADGDVVGRACVIGYEQSGPTEALPAVLAGGSESCVDLAPGDTSDLALALAVSEVQSGEYSGNVLVELSAPNDPLIEPATVRVPVGFAGYAPLCTGVLVGTIVGVLALAALVVLVLLYLLARFAARFPREPRNIAFGTIDLTLSGEAMHRAGGSDLSLTPEDFRGLVTQTDADGQTLALGDTGVTVTPRPRWFGMPQATIHLHAAQVIGCEDGVLQRGPFSRAGRIRHELAGSWALEVSTASVDESDEAGSEVVTATGTLWVLRDIYANPASVYELTERVRQGLAGSRVQSSLRRLAERSMAADSEASSGGLLGRIRRQPDPDVRAEDYTPPEPRRL
jgi:hypothetical protein